MAHEVNRYRLNYMQAYVKQYDDGSEILQSYTTDVVKKTPNGKYIRLWSGWSTSTSKQVSVWCGKRFRDIPFADGTVEDRTVQYKRKGYDLKGWESKLTPEDCMIGAKRYAASIKNGQGISCGYSTIFDKELKQIYKGDKAMLRLMNILSSCAKHKIKGNDEINVLIKLYNFDFKKVWESGLCELYPTLIL